MVNYEVDRTVEHVDHQRGQLQRLSVAVVINHRSVLDEEGVPQLVPRSEEELDYINRLVRRAMGFSEVRGDQLEVVNSVFVRQRTTDEQLPWYEQPSMVDFIKQLARYVVAGIGVLLLYLLILRPLLKRYTPAPTVTEPVETRDRLRAVVGDDDDAVAANGSSRSRRAGGGYADDDELEVDDNTLAILSIGRNSNVMLAIFKP